MKRSRTTSPYARAQRERKPNGSLAYSRRLSPRRCPLGPGGACCVPTVCFLSSSEDIHDECDSRMGRLVLKYTVVRSWIEDVHYHRVGSDRCLVFSSERFLGVRVLSLLASMACG